MVTVTGYAVRQTGNGDPFVVLQLQGELTMVQSGETGRFYATVRRCSISSTFKEEEARALIGSCIPGEIVREETEPYDYTIEDTGEIIRLSHRWAYRPEEAPTAKKPPIGGPAQIHSDNGAEKMAA